MSVPDALRSSVLRRLRSLDRVGRIIILQASVIGRRFDLRAALAVSSYRESQVRAVLQQACRLQILETSDGLCYSFRHALTREIVYAELQAERIRPLHRRFARFLESMHHDGEPVLEALAYHAWAGGDRRRTLRYNELAGDRASAVYASDEACRYYARARGCIDADSTDYERLTQKLAAAEIRLSSISG